MIRLFDGSSNGLTTLSQILRRGQHTLGQLWTNQLSPQSTEDLEAANAVLPGLRAQFDFFSSSVADVALRLGPYMSISRKHICTRANQAH